MCLLWINMFHCCWWGVWCESWTQRIQFAWKGIHTFVHANSSVFVCACMCNEDVECVNWLHAIQQDETDMRVMMQSARQLLRWWCWSLVYSPIRLIIELRPLSSPFPSASFLLLRLCPFFIYICCTQRRAGSHMSTLHIHYTHVHTQTCIIRTKYRKCTFTTHLTRAVEDTPHFMPLGDKLIVLIHTLRGFSVEIVDVFLVQQLKDRWMRF